MTDWHIQGIYGEPPFYAQLYPCISLVSRGKLLDWWIFKYYNGAHFNTAYSPGTGMIVTKVWYSEQPRTGEQQGWRSVFYDAVKNWQGFDVYTKRYYNAKSKYENKSGYNRYLGLYLKANFPMIIYWSTLEKDAGDVSTIPDYISSDYFAVPLYPPAVKRLLALGPSGDLPLPKKVGVDTISEKTADAGVTVDGLLIKDGTPANWDGWIIADETWTYASSTTFTVSGDVRSKYPKGTKITLTQTTAKYFYVIKTSYSSPNTTVTITGGSNYTLADAAITDPFYSYMETPVGFPDSFTYTPTYGDGTMGYTPGGSSVRFRINGTALTIWLYANNGTTSGTATLTIRFTIPNPITIAYNVKGACHGRDGATIRNIACWWMAVAGNNYIDVYKGTTGDENWGIGDGRHVSGVFIVQF